MLVMILSDLDIAMPQQLSSRLSSSAGPEDRGRQRVAKCMRPLEYVGGLVQCKHLCRPIRFRRVELAIAGPEEVLLARGDKAFECVDSHRGKFRIDRCVRLSSIKQDLPVSHRTDFKSDNIAKSHARGTQHQKERSDLIGDIRKRFLNRPKNPLNVIRRMRYATLLAWSSNR